MKLDFFFNLTKRSALKLAAIAFPAENIALILETPVRW